MCKINKKQNAHGVTFRSLWNLGQPRIQEGKAGAKYIQNGSNQIQTKLLVRFFFLLPLSLWRVPGHGERLTWIIIIIIITIIAAVIAILVIIFSFAVITV